MVEARRVTFSGRIRKRIEVGGENVAPAMLEECHHAHEAIRMDPAVGIADGRASAAFVELEPDGGTDVMRAMRTRAIAARDGHRIRGHEIPSPHRPKRARPRPSGPPICTSRQLSASGMAGWLAAELSATDLA